MIMTSAVTTTMTMKNEENKLNQSKSEKRTCTNDRKLSDVI